MKTHPAAEIFPLMDGAEFEALQASIKANGQRQAIITWKGQIVDGRNRLRACEACGEKPWIEEQEFADDADVAKFVVDSNITRRHLSESQRGMLSVKLEPFYKAAAEARMKAGKPVDPLAHGRKGAALKQAAADVNVGSRTASRSKNLVLHAVPELVAMVESGKLKVRPAEEVAKVLTAPEQRKLAKQGPDAVKAKASEIRQAKQKTTEDSAAPVDPEPETAGETVEEPEEGAAQPPRRTLTIGGGRVAGHDSSEHLAPPAAPYVNPYRDPPAPEPVVVLDDEPSKVKSGECIAPTCHREPDPLQCINTSDGLLCGLKCLLAAKVKHPDWNPHAVQVVNDRGDLAGFFSSLDLSEKDAGPLYTRVCVVKA